MKLTGWRIVQSRRAKSAFDGEGARLYGGRWNHQGTAVVYAASSPSLAVLEMLVHLSSAQILNRYVLIPIEFDDVLCIRLNQKSLPRNWRADPPPISTRDIGTDWVSSSTSAILAVPSTVVSTEQIYLLNPNHPNFGKIVVGTPRPFKYDARLQKT